MGDFFGTNIKSKIYGLESWILGGVSSNFFVSHVPVRKNFKVLWVSELLVQKLGGILSNKTGLVGFGEDISCSVSTPS